MAWLGCLKATQGKLTVDKEDGMAQVLLVDDSEFVHEQIGSMLDTTDVTYQSALGGPQALEKLRQDKEIKLIFLDINMPEMDGLEVLKLVKKEWTNRELSVVVLSGQLDPEMLSEAEQEGASGWIIKPPSLDNLLPFLEKYVGI